MNDGSVTFGDGNKALICERGSINAPRIPKLNYVLFVKGLKANLISISQICDNNYKVKFTKKDYTMLDKSGNALVIGIRSKDNYYCVGSHLEVSCNRSSLSAKELWH